MDIRVVLLVLVAIYIPVLALAWRDQNRLMQPYVFPESNLTSFRCAFCNERLTQIIDFGWTALAGGFLKPEQFDTESKYPLRLCFCTSCYAVQLADRVSQDTMFKNYFYFSSATQTIKQHFREYAKEVVERFNPKTAIEIGCNDGVLIEPLREAGVEVTGVDPSSTVPKADYIINDYFSEDVAARIGEVDMVIANNVFAHISDIRSATRAVVKALKPDGVFVMEAHSLGGMVLSLQYDWIYHEHIYYYSLLSLEKHFQNYGLRVFDIKPVNTHGGSIRYYVCKDDRPETHAVEALRRVEKAQGLDKLETFIEFRDRVELHRKDLRQMLEGRKVVGYGASGRANALIQFCGLDVSYIVDDAPAKQGYYTPGSHIPIVSTFQDEPEQVVVFAWTYADEIQKKCDFPLLSPLPEIQLIEKRLVA